MIKLRSLLKRSFSFNQHTRYYGGQKSLKDKGIKNPLVFRNLSLAQLYANALNPLIAGSADPLVQEGTISSTGALIAYSGERTGRSPKAKRVVEESTSMHDIWWDKVNTPLPESSWKINRQRAIDWLNTQKRIYIVDGYGGWDPKYRLKVRVVCTRPYHALFMRNMLIKPTEEQLHADFNDGADFTIFNAGEFNADPENTPGVRTHTSVALNFKKNEAVILGTQYAGEMKKGFFTVMHYLMPKQGILSMHASANEGKEDGDVTVLFGLSGTGKTTLSADPERSLIGDDEHCWTDDGIFNIEGGCYAKTINLSRDKEPEIYDAIKYGAVLENVLFGKDADSQHEKIVDYTNVELTENTRCCYPLEFIPGAKLPAVGGHPKNIIFLTCDAWGVLPPVAKLTKEQAMYHFISGYTAKVSGTEMGIVEPIATFSACFGEAFLPMHPYKYAKLLEQKLEKHNTNVWLVNTGWTGGKYGVGQRMSLPATRRILHAIHKENLHTYPTQKLDIFNLNVPTECPGVDPKILMPKDSWENKEDYDRTLVKLATLFQQNFKTYSKDCGPEVFEAGPHY